MQACSVTRRPLRALVTAVISLLLMAVSGCSLVSNDPASAPSPVPERHQRILLGTYTHLSNAPSTEVATEHREQAIGRHYDLEVTYYDWKDPFPDFGEATIVAHDRIPVMTWYGPGKDPSDHHTLAEVNNGSQDEWITRQAKAIKQFGKTIYLRPMIEMNGDWYKGYSGNPQTFIAAWRRIHRLFQEVGVPNVHWVWCPNLTPHNWRAYYPGDAYVDIIGVDGYNTATNGSWSTFQQQFDPFFREFAGRKPLMVAETATDSSGGSAADYITAMHTYLKDTAGPRFGVIALCWFDTDTNTDMNGTHNWRVDQTTASWRAWLALARDPYFGGHRP